MTATRLSLYNGALRLCGDAKLASLTENREPRHLLDDVWDDGNGAIVACLELGDWNHAMRTVEAEASASVSPEFGHPYAFDKPTDWVKTSGIASDPYFRCPMTDLEYKDEAGYWYTSISTIYVRYVSNDSSYGLDYSKWPQSFIHLVQAFLAIKIIPRLKEAKVSRDDISKVFERALTNARSKDAMNEGASFPPPGGWASARMGGRGRFDPYRR
jgi:hypothetical protein